MVVTTLNLYSRLNQKKLFIMLFHPYGCTKYANLSHNVGGISLFTQNIYIVPINMHYNYNKGIIKFLINQNFMIR